MHACAATNCNNTAKSDHWNNIKNGDKGWFFQKDGTAYCPEHLPDWLPAWRARRANKE